MPIGTFLNGSPVTQLRGLAWLALSDEGQVGEGAVTDDGGGGGATVWTYGATVACRIDALAGDERMAASKLSDRSTHLITVPPETAMTAASRFVITGRGTFEVTAVRDSTDELMRFFEAVEVS